jgi:flagellar protein FliO/FliZ
MNGLFDRQRNVTWFTRVALLLMLQGVALAGEAPAFAAPAAAAQSSGAPGVGRVVISLILVLVLVLGGAWLTRRLSGMAGGANPRLRLLANISLGARERAVLIAVDGREVLLGVAPGNVRTLLVGDPPAVPDSEGEATGSAARLAVPGLKATFGDVLRRSLGR